MTTRIGIADFDSIEGEILLPQRSTHRFESSAFAYAGVQVLPVSAPPFTLKCIRMTPIAALQSDVAIITASVGQVLPIIHAGITYELAPYQLRFIVLDVNIIETRRLVLATGSRFGVPYTYTPAAQITAALTLQAVPIA